MAAETDKNSDMGGIVGEGGKERKERDGWKRERIEIAAWDTKEDLIRKRGGKCEWQGPGGCNETKNLEWHHMRKTLPDEFAEERKAFYTTRYRKMSHFKQTDNPYMLQEYTDLMQECALTCRTHHNDTHTHHSKNSSPSKWRHWWHGTQYLQVCVCVCVCVHMCVRVGCVCVCVSGGRAAKGIKIDACKNRSRTVHARARARACMRFLHALACTCTHMGVCVCLCVCVRKITCHCCRLTKTAARRGPGGPLLCAGGGTGGGGGWGGGCCGGGGVVEVGGGGAAACGA